MIICCKYRPVIYSPSTAFRQREGAEATVDAILQEGDSIGTIMVNRTVDRSFYI